MSKAYPIELRQRAMEDIDKGMIEDAVAAKYKVSSTTIANWKKKRKDTGSFAPPDMHGRAGRKRVLKNYQELLLKLVKEHPDATQQELAKMMSQTVKCDDSMVNRELAILKQTYKKNALRQRTRAS